MKPTPPLRPRPVRPQIAPQPGRLRQAAQDAYRYLVDQIERAYEDGREPDPAQMRLARQLAVALEIAA